MAYAIRGHVSDPGNPTASMAYLKVKFALDVGLEFDDLSTGTTTSTTSSGWTTYTNGSGLFSILVDEDDVEEIFAGRRHREVIFKAFDSSDVLLGIQSVYISRAALQGTETVSLSIPSTYTLVGGPGEPNFAVAGFLTDAEGTPSVGVTVELNKKALRNLTSLGSAVTGDDGGFLIRYAGSAGEHSDRASFSIALEAAAASATAGHFCNPPANFTVRLVEDDEVYRGKSEFDLDVATLSPLLDGATLDELTVDDVTFLVCRTQHDSATSATLVRAHALADQYSIPAAALVALSHAGIPLSTNAIVALSDEEIEQAIQRAVENNLVPSSLTSDIATVQTTLAAARIDRMVPSSTPESTTLGAILVAASLTAGLPRDFAELYAAHTGTAEEFWTALRGHVDFGDTVVDRIQFTLQVGALTASYPPLVKLLHAKRDANVFALAAELAQYDADDWVGFLGETVDGDEVDTPPGVIGVDSSARRTNYAGAIAKMVEDLYPSAHLAYRVPPGAVMTPVADIAAFVVANPGFSFQRTNIVEFFPGAEGLPVDPEDQEALRQDLLRIQRVSSVTPRYGRTAASSALLTAGVTSASQIQRMGFAAFQAKLAGTLDAPTIRATYEKADQVASTALHRFLHSRKEMHFPLTAVITSPGCGDVDLEALFGNLDYCACKHCESVYGPAAYLVDILQFLRHRDAGEQTLLDVLLERRPEVEHILLNCENSETPLPTIDLVLETLERRAHAPLGLDEVEYEESSDWPQTTWSASELATQPEHVDPDVYTKLADHTVAYFPHTLPFDLPLEVARAYLQSFGTSRLKVQDALEWFDDLDEDLVFRVDDRLGLSPGQGKILRNAAGTKPIEALWGFEEGSPTYLSQINGVELFLKRAGLDLPGLQTLMRGRVIAEVDIEYDEPCTLKDARLVLAVNHETDGLTTVRLWRLLIFLRLHRALGWSMPDLDATLAALNTWFASDVPGDLEKLAQFVRVRQRFPQVALGEVHAWFGTLDRHVYAEGAPTYYDVVVQPRLRHEAFMALNGSTQFGDHHGDLLAILQTDDAGLAAAYAATGLSSTSDLNLANLSHIYRVSSLARAVGLSIPDLVTVVSYSQSLAEGSPGPFAGTADAPVRQLLELAQAVARSGFSVPALDWVLRNKNGDKFGASDLDVTRILIGLITALQQADADHAQSLPPGELSVFARVEKLLAGPLPATKIVSAMAFVRKETDPPPADNAAAIVIRNELLFFLVSGSSAHIEFGKKFDTADTADNRALMLEIELKSWLRRQRLERLVVQQLAVALGMETADADLLLRTYNGDSTPALTTLTADAFFAAGSFDSNLDAANVKEPGFPSDFLARTDVGPRAELYRELRKVAFVAATFRLAPGLLRWLLAHRDDSDVQLLDLTQLPSGEVAADIYAAFSGWDWLRRAVRIRDEVLRDPSTLTLLLDLFFRSSGFDKSLALAELAKGTGWDAVVFAAFEASETVNQAELKELEAVEAFDAAFRLSTRLGVDPEVVRTWAKDEVVDATAAEAIQGAAEAKFGPTAWPSVAQPIRDRLRQRQRDALVDLLVHETGVEDHEDLFGTLLMDVDIACCNRTTRILFATGAVQLFMQRALMGLESEHDVELSDLDADEWEWMKRYRVWEANRKIFLYPENWVQPELRTDKTPLFKRLEEEIAQSEADDASIEKAYIHYLEGLHEVARLDVCGMYHEVEQDGVVLVDRLHVFAATYGNPFKTFYRRREDDAYWTAWEELPFQVESRSMLPLVVNRRLMLIWPKVEHRADEPAVPTEDKPTAPTKRRYIRLVWVEYKDGSWTAPRTSEAALRVSVTDQSDAGIEGRHPNSDVFLISQVAGTRLLIYTGRIGNSDKTKKEAIVAGYFVYDACLDRFEAVGLPLTPFSAYGKDSLNGDYPVPNLTRSWRQGFTAYNGEDSSPPDSMRFVRLPVPGGPNQGLVYSDKLLRFNTTDFKLILPRQDGLLNGRRPFIYTDPVTTLYLRTGEQHETDPNPDKSPADELVDKDLGKYFQFGEGKVDPNDLPTDELALMVEGDEGPESKQMSGMGLSGGASKYNVALFYHPYTCLFIEQVRRSGVPGLLDPNVATLDDETSLVFQSVSAALPESYFEDVTAVWKPVPPRNIDFRFGGAYSTYNWELFFHIPMYVADRLMAERRFAEAQRWLGYIFNPIRKATAIEGTDCKHFWRIKPFRQLSANSSIAAILELLSYTGDDAELKDKKADLSGQIAQWRKNPFQPHEVARMRPTAYMRAVVMKYLDNLIAWGDDLFRQDTRESTQEAVQLYILALQILGKRPRKVDGEEHADKTYHDANDDFDDFSNFLVEIENEVIGFAAKDFVLPLNSKGQKQLQMQANAADLDHFVLAYANPPGPAQLLAGSAAPPPKPPRPPFNPIAANVVTPTETELYFCIPPNDKLLGYWDTVADRLFKLRNCLNIEGVRRDLALFEPPIDPGLLAKAAAQGIDIGTAVSNLYAPLPHYRFLPHLGIAKDFAAQVSSLGNLLLQALEKRDAEALAVLRGGHEVSLLKSVRQVREQAVKEGAENIEALRRGLAVVEARERYYKSRERMNKLERAELGLTIAASVVDAIGGVLLAAGGVASAVPTFNIGVSGYAGTPVVTVATGGQHVGGGLAKAGQAMNVAAGVVHRVAGVLGTQASYTRRKDEWEFQAEASSLEIKQLDRQLTAAKIRLAMAERELANHDVQLAQSTEALETMRSKFTNAELYSWMATELSKVYHSAYQLAIDLARRAERCYRYELAIADDTDDFIQFGHWDNRRQGLLAGERLQHDLRRMEAAYYQNHRREYELTKRVSLASLDPVALIALRKTGACHFNLPSIIFNLDHASHYLRRIKLVGLSMPAVAGPYTNIGATLTYESGSLRSTPGGDVAVAVGAAQSVAISVSQEDSGLFEPNLRDERYLPFEGRALEDSHWRVELPGTVRQFDYETISDVILTIRYTAREGGETTKTAVGDLMNAEDVGVNTFLRADADTEPERGVGQVQVFSARAEFPEAWRSFIADGHEGGETELVLDLGEQRFPHPQKPPGVRKIDFVAVFARWPADASIAPSADAFDEATLTPLGGSPIDLGFSQYKLDEPASGAKYNYLWSAKTNSGLDKSPGIWSLSVPHGWPDQKSPEDVIFVVGHTVS